MTDAPKRTASKKKPVPAGTAADLEARLILLRAEIDEMMSSLGNTPEGRSQAAASVAGAAEDVGDDIMKEARKALKQIHKQASSLEKTLGVETRRNPVQSLAIAFGIGFLASLLVRR